MTPFLQLILMLAIILFSAKVSGYISIRFLHQPAVLGEMLVGVVLGPSLLNLVRLPAFDTSLEQTLQEFSELGVLLLMFLAGLELNTAELAKSGRVSALAGALGVLVPVGLGFGAGLLFGLDMARSFYLGLTMGATSVSISAQTLMEMKVLRTRVGVGLLGAAVFDDILVILILSIFLALGTGSGSLASVVWVVARMAIFLALSMAFGLYLLPRIAHRVSHLPISQGTLTIAVVLMLLFGLGAELLGGIAAITGAFLAGLMYSRTPERESLERNVSALAYGFFVPVFFVGIGLTVNLRLLNVSALWLTLVVTFLAVAGKLLGAGWGARLAGLPGREAWQLGAGMVSRGEVGLILASVGISENLLSQGEFSAIIGMVLITTLLTPPLLRSLLKSGPAPLPVRGQEGNS
jgi:Kef-type K+ transport system membrane component KefB